MVEQRHNNTMALLLFILGSKIVISTEVIREDNMLSQGCNKPRIVPWSQETLTVRAGSQLNLTCQTDCHHLQMSFDWILELSTGEVLVISNKQKLVIKSLTFQDSGALQCYSHINNMALISDPITVSVVGPPYIDTEEDIANLTTNVGDALDVEVLFCSRPPATVSWILTSADTSTGNLMLLSGSIHGRFSSNTRWYNSEGHCYIAHLHINSLRIMDTGNFALQLDNSEGGIQRTFHITVTTPIISETASIWFFVLFFFACLLLVLSRFTNLGRSKPAVLV